jgi:hypothetical protein
LAGFKDTKDRVQRAIKDLITRQYMTELGKFAADMIRLRTQLGYGVGRAGAPREPLKPLSESYKQQRKKMQLNSNTSPTKSNLTRTGQLLSSHDVKSVSGATVVVGPTGSRNDGLTNEQVGTYVADQGRPYNNLSDVEAKRLREKIRKDLQTMLQKSLAKTRR